MSHPLISFFDAPLENIPADMCADLCLSEQVAFMDVCAYVGRMDSYDSDVFVQKCIESSRPEMIKYLLELFLRSQEVSRFFSMWAQLMLGIAKTSYPDVKAEFDRRWPQYESAMFHVWDTYLEQIRSFSNPIGMMTLIINSWNHHDLSLKYLITHYHAQGFLDDPNSKTKAFIQKTSLLDPLAMIMGLREPRTEQEKEWLVRYRMGGYVLTQTMTDSMEECALSL